MTDHLAVGPGASLKNIEKASNALLGRRFGEIAQNRDFRIPVASSKNLLGDIIQEDYFKISKNSREEPDFNREGIELKVTPLVPMRSDTQLLKQKEAMALSQIDYHELCNEKEWTNVSKLTNKLGRTLIIWYLHLQDEVTETSDPTDVEKAEARKEYPIVWWHLWEPLKSLPPQMQEDYATLREEARAGNRLSRSMTTFLSSISKHSGKFDDEDPSQSDPRALSPHPYIEYARKNGYYIDSGLVEIIAESANIDVVHQNGRPRINRSALLRQMEKRATGESYNLRRDHSINEY